MSGGDWPADPTDPRCPACGEPVSATASYCLHCYEDLPGTEATAAPTVDAPDLIAGGSPAATTAGGTTGVDPTAASVGATDEDRGWLHPDGLLDDASTLLVGLVGGVVDGFLLLLLAIWALPEPVEASLALPIAATGWLAATAWIAYTRTVFGAVRKAASSLAALLALVPLVLAFVLRDPGAFLFGIVLWPLALVVAAVGRFAGRGAVQEA